MPAPFDDTFASLLSKTLSRLEQPAEHADKPAPRKPARAAIRSVRLRGPAGRVPLRLAFAAGANSPAAGLLLHVRLWPYAPLTPAFRRGWRQSVFIAHQLREVVQAGIPLEPGGTIQPPSVAISFPGPRAVGQTRAVSQPSFVGSPWRIAPPATAEPMEFLTKGSSLPACEYRTRSML